MPTYPLNSTKLRGIASIAEANRVTLTEVAAGVDLEFFKEATSPAPGTSGISFLFSPSEPLPVGYTRVRAATRFADNGRFGFAGDGKVTERDQFVFTTDATFMAVLPDGLYDVTVWLGDHRDITHDHMGVFFQGVHVGTVSSPKRTFVPATFRVNVTDGRLVMRLKDLEGPDPNVCIRSLVVVPATGAAPAPPPAPPDADRFVLSPIIPQFHQANRGACSTFAGALRASYQLRRAGVADYRVSPYFRWAIGQGFSAFIGDVPYSAFPHQDIDPNTSGEGVTILLGKITREHLILAAMHNHWDWGTNVGSLLNTEAAGTTAAQRLEIIWPRIKAALRDGHVLSMEMPGEADHALACVGYEEIDGGRALIYQDSARPSGTHKLDWRTRPVANMGYQNFLGMVPRADAEKRVADWLAKQPADRRKLLKSV